MTDHSDEIIRLAMSLIGKRTSPSKAETARKNGKLGGRPVGSTGKKKNAKKGKE